MRPLHHAGCAVAVPLPRFAGQEFSKLLPCALLRGGGGAALYLAP
jgi:hypothetical protein